MAYDEELANRVREIVGGERGLAEKRMFGGLAMLLGGHMSVVIRGKGGLMVRVADADLAAALAESGTKEAVMRGSVMHGWVVVEAKSVDDDADLRRWVARAVSAARALPPN